MESKSKQIESLSRIVTQQQQIIDRLTTAVGAQHSSAAALGQAIVQHELALAAQLKINESTARILEKLEGKTLMLFRCAELLQAAITGESDEPRTAAALKEIEELRRMFGAGPGED